MAKKEETIVKKVVVEPCLSFGWEWILKAHNNSELAAVWYPCKATAKRTAKRLAAQLDVPLEVK